jgi:uncharacterized protein with HEPN domain
MSHKEKYIYFQIMLESLEKLTEYIGEMTFDEFDHDNKTFDACLMQFQHLGKTANKLKTNFPDDTSLPYTKIIGMRNFIAHEYLGIDIGIIWDTLTTDVPALHIEMEKLLKQ